MYIYVQNLTLLFAKWNLNTICASSGPTYYNPKAAILWDGGNDLVMVRMIKLMVRMIKSMVGMMMTRLCGGLGPPTKYRLWPLALTVWQAAAAWTPSRKEKLGLGKTTSRQTQRRVQIVKVYDSPSPNITLSPATTLLLLYPFYSLHYIIHILLFSVYIAKIASITLYISTTPSAEWTASFYIYHLHCSVDSSTASI